MSVIHGSCIVIDKQLMFCITTSLYIIPYIYNITMQDHGSGIRIGEADLTFARVFQLFFYEFVRCFFTILIFNFSFYVLLFIFIVSQIYSLFIISYFRLDIVNMAVYFLLVKIIF